MVAKGSLLVYKMLTSANKGTYMVKNWQNDANMIYEQPLKQIHIILQLLNFAYKQLLNKPYENEVTLTRQNPPLKSYQPLEILTHWKEEEIF